LGKVKEEEEVVLVVKEEDDESGGFEAEEVKVEVGVWKEEEEAGVNGKEKGKACAFEGGNENVTAGEVVVETEGMEVESGEGNEKIGADPSVGEGNEKCWDGVAVEEGDDVKEEDGKEKTEVEEGSKNEKEGEESVEECSVEEKGVELVAVIGVGIDKFGAAEEVKEKEKEGGGVTASEGVGFTTSALA